VQNHDPVIPALVLKPLMPTASMCNRMPGKGRRSRRRRCTPRFFARATNPAPYSARDNATVVILDRDLTSATRTAAELSSPGLALQLNVSDGAAVKSAIATVLKKFGRIDAVHNSAGIATPSKPLHETSEEEWDNLQRNNVKSVYLDHALRF
jgi:enoyl-ACP reductase-like protein